MKYSPIFKQYLDCSNEEDTFAYLISNLNHSITCWDYFVNWTKVIGNIKDLEIDLNTLNYLVGKADVKEELKVLLRRQPSIARLIPILLACRESDFLILTDYRSGDLLHESFSFNPQSHYSDIEIDSIADFASNTGLLKMFQEKFIKSVPDYVIGVEVGLDTNGRKNRGGTSMENIVENYLLSICAKNHYDFMKQATSEKIKEKWNLDVKVDKSSRRFDFGIKAADSLYLIETNYYSGGGSKLKSTAGEYKALYDFLNPQGHHFVWITDGLGWKSTIRPLNETFNHIDYILNLKMVSLGLLEEIIKNRL